MAARESAGSCLEAKLRHGEVVSLIRRTGKTLARHLELLSTGPSSTKFKENGRWVACTCTCRFADFINWRDMQPYPLSMQKFGCSFSFKTFYETRTLPEWETSQAHGRTLGANELQQTDALRPRLGNVCSNPSSTHGECAIQSSCLPKYKPPRIRVREA